MAANYKALKGNRARDNFRRDWCKTEAMKMKEVREKRDSEWVETNKVGTYRPFSGIVQKEGNDAPAYIAAVENVKSCIELCQEIRSGGGW